MAKKKTSEQIVKEIKDLLKQKKFMMGLDRTLKNLKQSKLSKVYVTSNCPEDVMDEINHYSKLANVKIIKLKYSNDELGAICKKPFSISIMGLLKE